MGKQMLLYRHHSIGIQNILCTSESSLVPMVPDTPTPLSITIDHCSAFCPCSLPVPEFSISRIVQYAMLCAWLLLFCKMKLRCTKICDLITCSFIEAASISFYPYSTVCLLGGISSFCYKASKNT